jgi:hypothetical protein
MQENNPNNKITDLTVCKNGLEGAFKSPAILVQTGSNILSPIVYFRKPRHLSDKQFKAVIDDIMSQFKGLSEETIEVLEAQ